MTTAGNRAPVDFAIKPPSRGDEGAESVGSARALVKERKYGSFLKFGTAAVLMVACGGTSNIGDGIHGVQNRDAGSAAGGKSGGTGGSTGTGGAVTGSGGAVNNSGGASGGGAQCKSAGECAVPAICKQCSDGSSSCATGGCVNGQCVTTFPPCAGGNQCSADADCPIPPVACQPCPDGGCKPASTSCVNGQCSTTIGACPVSGGLTWFRTCGPPVCQADPQPSGLPACTASELAGTQCSKAGAQCDTGASCAGPLVCAATDPRHGGACPVSRAAYKRDIQYFESRRARRAGKRRPIDSPCPLPLQGWPGARAPRVHHRGHRAQPERRFKARRGGSRWLHQHGGSRRAAAAQRNRSAETSSEESRSRPLTTRTKVEAVNALRHRRRAPRGARTRFSSLRHDRSLAVS